MSEFQYIGFRAAEKPVSDKDLEYMRQQSSRAEITPWSFDNEYHYGDFRGDALNMLRRGYDIHLHYANFGIRKLLIGLPHNLPNTPGARPYFAEDGLQFLKDKQGQGGILSISPYYEPGDQDELWNVNEILDRLVPLRAEILEGDLRPLYLAHLADDVRWRTRPGGNNRRSSPRRPGKPHGGPASPGGTVWPQRRPDRCRSRGQPRKARARGSRGAVCRLASEPPASDQGCLASGVAGGCSLQRRSDMLAEFRKSRPTAAWPTVQRDRTIAELETAAEDIHKKAVRKADEKAARQRAKRLADMVADPAPTLRETERLVKLRSRDSYIKIATLLKELREALAGTKQSGLAEQQAQKLKKENPTLNLLTAELRRAGFVAK